MGKPIGETPRRHESLKIRPYLVQPANRKYLTEKKPRYFAVPGLVFCVSRNELRPTINVGNNGVFRFLLCCAEVKHLVKVQVLINFASHRIDVLRVFHVLFTRWDFAQDRRQLQTTLQKPSTRWHHHLNGSGSYALRLKARLHPLSPALGYPYTMNSLAFLYAHRFTTVDVVVTFFHQLSLRPFSSVAQSTTACSVGWCFAQAIYLPHGSGPMLVIQEPMKTSSTLSQLRQTRFSHRLDRFGQQRIGSTISFKSISIHRRRVLGGLGQLPSVLGFANHSSIFCARRSRVRTSP